MGYLMVLKNTLIFTLIRGQWFCSNSHYLLEIYTIDIIVSNEIIRSLGFAQNLLQNSLVGGGGEEM